MKRNQYIKIGAISLVIVTFMVFTYFVVFQTSDNLLERHGLDQLSMTEIVSKLEDDVNDGHMNAGIYGDRIEMEDDTGTYKMKLPADQFYLSVAPYMSETHPCGNHDLTGCQGEFVHKKAHVKVSDHKGNVIIDEDVKTYKNGFFGLWLPKNIEGTITVDYGDKTASTAIETYETSGTCLTTLHLK